MANPYPQYRRWAELPEQYEMSEQIPSQSPPPIPPKIPISVGPPYPDESTERLVNNPAKDSQQQTPKWRRKSFKQKWLGGLLPVLRGNIALTVVILATNIAWFIWASAHYKPSNGYGTIQQGDCGDSKTLNRWLHLGINVLSTGLLLGSSAFMAAATAPSRREIDLAHRQAKWLHVGLLSFRNISNVSVKKLIACVVLASTSLPVHLFYNSVIFPSLSANDYFWAVVTEDFVTGAPFNLSNANYNTDMDFSPFEDFFPSGLSLTPVQWYQTYEAIQSNVSLYDRLDNQNCLKAYSNRLLANRRNVMAVSSARNLTNSVFAFSASETDNEGDYDPTNWLCSQYTYSESLTCDPTQYLDNPQTWEVYGFPIEYCLSERTSESCSVRFSSVLAVTVIVCNIIKLITEVYILFWGDLDDAITCVGDAIASFLRTEDTTTRDMCLISVKDVDKAMLYPGANRMLRRYVLSRPRWAAVISNRRWTVSLLILGVAAVIVGALFGVCVSFIQSKGFDTSISGLWSLGFGSIDPEALVSSENFGTPITLSMLANLPQLILAMIYYLYSGMLTSFFTAQEYSSFAFKTQHLRVASPVGKQRGTWLLGMPLLWGLMYLIIQIALHWFVSQGFFVVEVSVFNEFGVLDSEFGSISNCGISPMPMLFAVIIAVAMMLMTVILGLRRFRMKSPPVAGNCSAVISAACHLNAADDDTPFQPLKWGCTGIDVHNVGHCSFAVAHDDEGNELRIDELQEGVHYR